MPNTELFRKIDEVIRAHPGQHDQGAWEGQSGGCGTTRCVAGWAIYLTTGTPVFESDSSLSLHPEVKALEERLDVLHLGSDDEMVPVIAQKLLGLNDEQAEQLFYTFSNRRAVELVRDYTEDRS